VCEIKTQAIPFKAGRIQRFSEKWKTITSDDNILEMVEGWGIEFQKKSPSSIKASKNNSIFSPRR
jgi:transposase